jgi:hypothetical protein
VGVDQSPVGNYTYDENGNMTCRAENGETFVQTYNAENRISTVQKLTSGDCTAPGTLDAHWAFAYDGDGTRTQTLYTPYVDGLPQAAVLTAYIPSLRSGQAWAGPTK